MAARNGGDTDDRADTRIPSKEEGEAPLAARYPMIAFSFNMDASRLVLLYRDPATGKTVDQIPSETALKQYEQAQKKEERRQRLEVIVGGAAGDTRVATGTGTGTGTSGPSATAAPSTPVSNAGNTSGNTSGSTAGRNEGAAASSGVPVPSSTPSVTSGPAPRVNVVI